MHPRCNGPATPVCASRRTPGPSSTPLVGECMAWFRLHAIRKAFSERLSWRRKRPTTEAHLPLPARRRARCRAPVAQLADLGLALLSTTSSPGRLGLKARVSDGSWPARQSQVRPGPAPTRPSLCGGASTVRWRQGRSELTRTCFSQRGVLYQLGHLVRSRSHRAVRMTGLKLTESRTLIAPAPPLASVCVTTSSRESQRQIVQARLDPGRVVVASALRVRERQPGWRGVSPSRLVNKRLRTDIGYS